MQFDNFALKSNACAFASRSKAKAKPQRRTLASPSTRISPIWERKWTDVEPEDYSPVDYPVSKQLSALLRHGHLPREDDGAIEFWRIRNIFGTILCDLNIGLRKVQEYNGKRRRKQEKISVLY